MSYASLKRDLISSEKTGVSKTSYFKTLNGSVEKFYSSKIHYPKLLKNPQYPGALKTGLQIIGLQRLK